MNKPIIRQSTMARVKRKKKKIPLSKDPIDIKRKIKEYYKQ